VRENYEIQCYCLKLLKVKTEEIIALDKDRSARETNQYLYVFKPEGTIPPLQGLYFRQTRILDAYSAQRGFAWCCDCFRYRRSCPRVNPVIRVLSRLSSWPWVTQRHLQELTPWKRTLRISLVLTGVIVLRFARQPTSRRVGERAQPVWR
jgi:hypothetical protein